MYSFTYSHMLMNHHSPKLLVQLKPFVCHYKISGRHSFISFCIAVLAPSCFNYQTRYCLLTAQIESRMEYPTPRTFRPLRVPALRTYQVLPFVILRLSFEDMAIPPVSN